MHSWRILLAFGVVAAVYLFRLDQPLLWGDEADTGILARNVLRVGYPAAYDDRNVTVFENGSQLNTRLVSKKIPWLQYYVGAASLTLFGDNTAGLRVLFAAIGALAFVPIYLLLRGRVRCAEAVAALALLAPQTVLFQRNARYYSILICLYAVLVWLVGKEWKRTRDRFIVAAVLLVLLFHTHPLAAACSALALVVSSAVSERRFWRVDALAAVIGFLSWLAWYVGLGSSLHTTPLLISNLASDFLVWLQGFGAGLMSVVVDVDAVNCVPLLLWGGLLIWIVWRQGRASLEIFRKPLPAFLLLNFLIEVVVSAAVFGSESANEYALLRYMPHLLVFAMISALVLLDRLIPNKAVFWGMCVLLVATNLLSWSFWMKPTGREVPITWVAPVYREVFLPRASSWDAAFAYLRLQENSSLTRSARIISLPSWTQEMTLFYLGDLFLGEPILQAPADDVLQAIQRAMGEEATRRLMGPPDWIIDLQNTPTPDGYSRVLTIPAYRSRPDDGSRPELTRHTFDQRDVVAEMRLYRLEKP